MQPGRMFATFALAFSTDIMAYESPDFTVVARTAGYEIRNYPPRLVAETVVDGSFRPARNAAFRRLFAYISGENVSADEIEMTAPVTTRAGGGAGLKIDMTVPVTTTGASESEAHVMRFFLPAGYTLESAPRPTNEKVQLRKLPSQRFAAMKYTGSSGEENFSEHRAELLEALARDGLAVDGLAELAVYNGPFTPWFLRTNEVLVPLRAD